VLLKVSGALSQEDESYWFSLKTGLSIEVTRCTTKVGVFSNKEEFSLFQVLKNVKGVGNINMIKAGNEHELALLPGIGERTAKRIVAELSGRLTNTRHDFDNDFMEVVNAACDLGYERNVVTELLNGSSEWRDKTLEDALRWVIRELNKKA